MEQGNGTERWRHGDIASELSEHVRLVVSSAEDVGDAVRREAEEMAVTRLREADEQAQRRIGDARREAESLVAERRRRLADLSDAVMRRGESLLLQLEQADALRRQLDRVLDAFNEAADQLVDDERSADAPRGGMASVERRPVTIESPTGEAQATDTAPTDRGLNPFASLARRPQATPASEAIGVTGPAYGADEQARESEPRSPGLGHDENRSARDFEAARVVARQMAVAGSTRPEVAAHLQRTFGGPNLHVILDEVFGGGKSATRGTGASTGVS